LCARFAFAKEERGSSEKRHRTRIVFVNSRKTQTDV